MMRVEFTAPCPGCGQDADWTSVFIWVDLVGDYGYPEYTITHDGPCEQRTAA